jgi:hypothetical protein
MLCTANGVSRNYALSIRNELVFREASICGFHIEFGFWLQENEKRVQTTFVVLFNAVYLQTEY